MFAGLDIGTTDVKFSVYSDAWKMVEQQGMAHEAYRNGRFDYSLLLQAAKAVVKGCKNHVQDVQALAVSTAGEFMESLDTKGNVEGAAPTLNGSYPEELQWLQSHFSPYELFNLTGLLPQARFPCAGILHRKRSGWKNQRFSMLEDYIVHSLTGEYVISASSAARSMLLDLHTGLWANKLLDCIGIGPAILPRIARSGSVLGIVNTQLASSWGLAPGTAVVGGGHDQFCNWLGASLAYPDYYVNCSGTMESIGFQLPVPNVDVAFKEQLQLCPSLDEKERFTFFAPVRGCGSLNYYMDTYGHAQRQAAFALSIHPNDYAARFCSRTPSPVLTVPYFFGRGYPDPNANLREVILDEGDHSSFFDVWQSILEGIAFEVRRCMDIYQRIGLSKQGVCAVGGGAKSGYWLQMKADIWECPVCTLTESQAGTLGAALLAGNACGVNAPAGLNEKRGQIYSPDAKRAAQYRLKFERYKSCVANQYKDRGERNEL